MGTPTNQKVAARMMEVSRRGGYSLGLFLRWQAKRYVVAVIYLAVAVAYFAYFRLWSGCSLVIGLFSGMWLRDFGYLLAAKKTWPFLNMVTNWEKVKKIADGEQTLE
jgi:hypothetical protein